MALDEWVSARDDTLQRAPYTQRPRLTYDLEDRSYGSAGKYGSFGPTS